MMLIPLLSILVGALASYICLMSFLAPNTPSATPGTGLMFDEIASYYDVANSLMSLGYDQSWRDALVDRPQYQNGNVIIDMATGTGEVALLVAEKLELLGHQRSKVFAVDPSIKMLEKFKKKLSESTYEKYIEISHSSVEGIASHHPEKSVDIVLMSFGIRNVFNRFEALSALRKVIKPDGKLYILEFVAPNDHSVIGILARLFVRWVVPLIGTVASLGHAKEYHHLEASIFNFPSPQAFLEVMNDAGFVDTSAVDIFHGVVHIFEGRVRSEPAEVSST